MAKARPGCAPRSPSRSTAFAGTRLLSRTPTPSHSDRTDDPDAMDSPVHIAHNFLVAFVWMLTLYVTASMSSRSCGQSRKLQHMDEILE